MTLTVLIQEITALRAECTAIRAECSQLRRIIVSLTRAIESMQRVPEGLEFDTARAMEVALDSAIREVLVKRSGKRVVN